MIHLQTLRRNGEAVLYAVLAVVGAIVAAVGASYGVLGDGGRVGPGFLPLVTGALTSLLCGAVTIGIIRRPTQGVEDELADDIPDIDTTGRTERQRVINLWIVFGLTLAVLLLVQLLGFLLAFGLLVVVISSAVERQPWSRSLIIAAVAVAFVYGVFGVFLSVPLPGGLLGLGTEG